jgi:hypothetical protein
MHLYREMCPLPQVLWKEEIKAAFSTCRRCRFPSVSLSETLRGPLGTVQPSGYGIDQKQFGVLSGYQSRAGACGEHCANSGCVGSEYVASSSAEADGPGDPSRRQLNPVFAPVAGSGKDPTGADIGSSVQCE